MKLAETMQNRNKFTQYRWITPSQSNKAEDLGVRDVNGIGCSNYNGRRPTQQQTRTHTPLRFDSLLNGSHFANWKSITSSDEP